MSPKKKLIYIAGSGRSGSTMLSLLLSQHPEVTNIGQIRDVFLARKNGTLCCCVERLETCPFWAEVLAQYPSETRRLGRLPKSTIAMAYRHAFDATSSEVVVDSSKSMDLCSSLLGVSDIDHYCLNLVRDPRAVAVSWSKVLKNRDVLGRRCQNWVKRQERAEKFRHERPDRFFQLRYEDLTRDPQHYVARIQAWAGLDHDLTSFDGPNSTRISWGDQHLFAPANEAVLKQRADWIEITPAVAWKSNDNRDVHLMAEDLCFPFAHRYGYLLGTC